MFRYLAAVVCVLATVISCSQAQAQLVRIGPYGGVSVRAPFVSVNTSPWGGTYVRAPFTRVYTPPRGVYVGPGYSYGYYPYPAPVIYEAYPVQVPVVVPVDPYPAYYAARPGSVAQTAYAQPIDSPTSNTPRAHALDPERVPAQLQAAADRLGRSLAQRRDDAEIWLDYLAPGKIIEAIDRGDPPASLRPLLTHYDGVVGNRELVSVVRADGFSGTRQLLRQYIADPRTVPARSVLDVSPPEGQRDVRQNAPTLAEPVEPAKEAPEAQEPVDPDVTSI